MEKITSVFPMGDKNAEVPAEGASNEWLEPVSEEEYSKLQYGSFGTVIRQRCPVFLL